MNKTQEEKRAQRAYKRHVRIWKFLQRAAYPFFKRIYGYSCNLAPELKAPYLVLANHNADLDPVFVGFSFPQQMYLVASEHIYRRGFASKILKWAFEPIAKIKGASDTLTVMKMIRTLRSGKNVCMFPEGNRSFNGVSGPINEATGKLIKTSAATLVTYKLTGGFFTTPRWGFGIRKGKFHGEVVNVYTPEQLKEMTPAEITNVVRRDLFEDAYATQKVSPVLYKGKNRAVGFESSYCVCPDCMEVGTIATEGNDIFCTKCGKRTVFGEDGCFSEGFNFHTVYEWDCWQEEYYKKFVSVKNDGDFFFSDKNIILRTVTADHSEVIVGIGELALYKEKFVFTYEGGSREILISQIPDMSIYGKCGLMFTDAEGVHYECLPANKGELYNARKYLSCWSYLR